MREDILNGNYNDPMELDSYALSRIDSFGENVEKLSKNLKENRLKYARKRKENSIKVDKDPDYSSKRNFKVVQGLKEPRTGDQAFVWPDYEAEAFEKELETFRARPESNTGYENKALNKKMTDMFGDQAKKCINNTLFKESRTRKSLKESEKSSALLKQYEKDCDWYFVQNEDVDDLLRIVDTLKNAGNTYFSKYGYTVADKKANSEDPRSLYLTVNGYGRREAVNAYRIIFKSSDADEYEFFRDWCKVRHLGRTSSSRNTLEKQVQKYFKAAIENVCESVGYEITDVAFSRCGAYDDTPYVYVDLKPTKKLNALNNLPTEKKLQKVENTIVKDTGAKLLAEVEGTKYWKFESYEGAEVIFTTCLKVDETDVYPSDDEAGYSENPNYGKSILYLDIPNTGYCNWNSGTGYVDGRHVKDMDAVESIATAFVKSLKRVGREVYENSNY